jgi:hypothetical protein
MLLNLALNHAVVAEKNRGTLIQEAAPTLLNPSNV